MQFYNPKTSTLILALSVSRMTVQIQLAKPIDPNAHGKPAKGSSVYDYKNALFFALTAEECARIFKSFDAIVKGTYNNPAEKNEKFRTTLAIAHFREDQPYRMLLSTAKDAKGNPTGSMMLTLLPPQQGTHISYIFRADEIDCFKSFIFQGFHTLPFMCAWNEGLSRAEKQKSYNDGTKSDQPVAESHESGETTFDVPIADQTGTSPTEIEFQW